LLRRGAISRAGQALESKGIRDLSDPGIWEQMREKHPDRKQPIKEEYFEVTPEEEIELKVEKILPKLDTNAAPGPSGLRNAHLRMWTGVFAPPSADEAIEHLEALLSDMANDKMPAWFMQAVQSAELLALVKADKKKEDRTADHRTDPQHFI
jgi:hypothetical protein